MCGKPLMVNDAGVSVTPQGFPSKFLFLKPLIDNREFNIVLTILTFTRSVRPTKKEALKIKPDYSTITNPYKGKNWTIPAAFIKE
jgi:hypothetical protein